MLVGRALGEPIEVQALPGGDHREGEVADLGALHPVEEDRHRHRAHLLVDDIAAGVGIDEPVDLLCAEYASVPLGVDQVDGVKRFDGHQLSAL
jgi:hypothetical protein